MTFGIRATMSSEVTEVRVDGEVVQLEASGDGRALTFDREYTSYSDAIARGPLALEFLSGATVRYRGSSAPGWCQDLCVYDSCPREELDTEVLYLAPVTGDFGVPDFSCLDCGGGDKFSRSCS